VPEFSLLPPELTRRGRDAPQPHDHRSIRAQAGTAGGSAGAWLGRVVPQAVVVLLIGRTPGHDHRWVRRIRNQAPCPSSIDPRAPRQEHDAL
jgi:hypothetical protein